MNKKIKFFFILIVFILIIFLFIKIFEKKRDKIEKSNSDEILYNFKHDQRRQICF